MKFTKFSVAAMLFAVAVLPSCQKDEFENPDGENSDYKGLVINEISSSDDFVEIYNGSNKEIDLSGFIINDASTWDDEAYLFADGAKIGVGEFIVVKKDDDFNFGISSGGDTIYILDGDALQVDMVAIPAEEDGKESYGRSTDGGETLVWFEKSTAGVSNTTVVDDTTTGGNENFAVIVNELSSKGEPEDWIELYNKSNADFDLAGYMMTDDLEDTEDAVTFAAGTTIKAGEYMVFEKDGAGSFGFGLSDGDVIYIVKDGEVQTQSEAIAEEADEDGLSWGRTTDGADTWQVFTTPTKGENNASVDSSIDLKGKVVINEIYTFGDQSTEEVLDWIELYNTTDEEISLEGLKMWEAGGVEEAWTFPAGSKIAAKGHYLVLTDKYAVLDDPINCPAWGLSKGPDEVIVLATSALNTLDEVECPSMNENESYGRITDGAEDFQIFAQFTKGTANTGAARPEFTNTSGIYVNEVYHDNSDKVPGDHDWNTDRDFIELYNSTDAEVNIGGWVMADDKGEDIFVIPADTKIAAKGYIVFEAILEDENKNPIPNEMNFEFGLGKSGDWVFLYNSADRNYSDLVDQIEVPSFKAICDNGYTYGRETDGADEWVIFTEASKGTSNNGKSIYSAE